MDQKDFEALLIDLYAIYNPNKASDINMLLNKYNGQEFDAVKTIFIRYNFRANPNYDPDLGTDKHVRHLIERYSSQDRVLQRSKFGKPSQVEVIEKKISEASEKAQEETAKVKREVEEFAKTKTSKLEEYFETKKKEIELKLRVLDEAISTKTQELRDISRQAQPIIEQSAPKEVKPKVELKLELNYDDVDMELPKELENMGPGSRILLYNSKREVKGLEVKDVLYDCISEEGKAIKVMTIHRV
jgi:hypothetical protein